MRPLLSVLAAIVLLAGGTLLLSHGLVLQSQSLAVHGSVLDAPGPALVVCAGALLIGLAAATVALAPVGAIVAGGLALLGGGAFAALTMTRGDGLYSPAMNVFGWYRDLLPDRTAYGLDVLLITGLIPALGALSLGVGIGAIGRPRGAHAGAPPAGGPSGAPPGWQAAPAATSPHGHPGPYGQPISGPSGPVPSGPPAGGARVLAAVIGTVLLLSGLILLTYAGSRTALRVFQYLQPDVLGGVLILLSALLLFAGAVLVRWTAAQLWLVGVVVIVGTLLMFPLWREISRLLALSDTLREAQYFIQTLGITGAAGALGTVMLGGALGVTLYRRRPPERPTAWGPRSGPADLSPYGVPPGVTQRYPAQPSPSAHTPQTGPWQHHPDQGPGSGQPPGPGHAGQGWRP